MPPADTTGGNGFRAQLSSKVVPLTLSLPWKPDSLHRERTADGATIALGRYFPRGERRFAEPVVLCHGLGANRYDLDFDERYSLARHLARRGFEAWVLELRGRGHASPPGRTSFDAQAQHDVRAALDTVLAAGGKRVFWVGHSKGGLAALAHLGKNPDAPIAAIAALGSPVAMQPDKGLQRFAKLATPLHALPFIPLRLLTRVATLTGLPPEPIGSYLVNVDNLEPRVVRQAIYNVSADVSGGVAKQFSRWAATGRFDADDGFDYFAALRHVRAPVLLVAGSKDKLATPTSVMRAAEVLGGPVEQHLALGYGHGDLTVGLRAPEEIFPRVAAFFERHASAASL
jgi:pimeloyl-ACP methyl ester carboxylesterase